MTTLAESVANESEACDVGRLPHSTSASSLGIVVIGRNEGDRLRACLESVAGLNAPVVYVDSGSSDGSVLLAERYGADVLELDLATPFTAGRARNAGLERLRQIRADLQYVQFVDGDCEMDPNWLPIAVAAMREQPRTAVIFGRLREKYPGASIYNRLCDLEWNATPIGEARACGGIALMRISAFLQVGGFDPSVLAAEDDELCLRLRRAGYSLRRLDGDMARHDAAITRFSQWWTRSVRCGWAYAQGAALHGNSPERHFVTERRRAMFWAGLLPLLILLLAWPTNGWSLLGLLLYPLSAFRFFRAMRRRGVSRYDAAVYSAACTIAKFPQLIGILRYDCSRGPQRLIEYK